MEKRVLVTGYEPFGGQRINPSWVTADMLPDAIGEVTLIKKEMPVEWNTALRLLAEYLEEYRPQAVLCVGQAGGTAKINIERVGVNLCNGADNKGVVMTEAPVFYGGPAAYFSTIPYESMLNAMKEAEIAAEYSFSAGTYLCNHILYGGLHFAATRYPGLRAGFLHVPFLPQQVEHGFSMPLEVMAKGVRLSVEEVCKAV